MKDTHPELLKIYESTVDGFWKVIFPQPENGSFDFGSYTLEEGCQWEEFLSKKLRGQLSCKDHHPNIIKTWVDIIYPEDLQRAYKAMSEHISSHGKSPYKLVVRYKNYDGKHLKVVCQGEAIFIMGKPMSMSGIHKLLEVSDFEIDNLNR